MNCIPVRIPILALGLMALAAGPTVAAVISGPNMDPNKEGLAFGANDAFDFGGWFYDEAATNGGNDVGAMVITGTQFAGAGMSVPVSNGTSAASPFAPNEPVDPALGAGLANGNVVRLSAWLANDPSNPVTVDPQIPPVLKFEFHGIALGTGGTTPAQDVQLDTDVNLGLGTFVTSGDLSTSEWRLFSHEYVLDDTQLAGGSWDNVEEMRPVIFTGDFTGSSPASGAYLVDNVLVEIFVDADAAAASPAELTNPAPPALVPEPGSMALLALAAGGLACLGRRVRA